MTAPLISVILPVFNAGNFVGQAVESILQQKATDFELIVIDDGSTDNSLKVIEKYAKLDCRIKIVSRENRGLVASLNEGILLARGTWIARMDADDISLPQRFERQLLWLEKTGADICGSWCRFFGTADKRVLKHPETDEAIKMALLFGSPFSHPTVMMKTELVKQLRYDKAWEKCEDYDLWERAARAGWRMTNVPEVLLRYRRHAAQISTAASTKQQELTQKIRRRYWEFVLDSLKMKIKREWIDDVLKLRESSLSKSNMDNVDSVFIELLHRYEGETRATIFDYATRLYYRAAADCPDVVARWGKLNRKFGSGFAFGTKLKLWLVSVLRIHSNSRSFERLKRIYFYLVRST